MHMVLAVILGLKASMLLLVLRGTAAAKHERYDYSMSGRTARLKVSLGPVRRDQQHSIQPPRPRVPAMP